MTDRVLTARLPDTLDTDHLAPKARADDTAVNAREQQRLWRMKIEPLTYAFRFRLSSVPSRETDNDNEQWYKYVRITTNQPNTKSNLNPNISPNSTGQID